MSDNCMSVSERLYSRLREPDSFAATPGTNYREPMRLGHWLR